MIYIIILIIVVIISLFLLRARLGLEYKIDTIHYAVQALLRRGYDGGFMIVTLGYSRKFIQIRKYINKPKDYGVELAFPNAKWSREYFIKLKEMCEKRGIVYNLVTEDTKYIIEFIYINFGKDVNSACIVMKYIISEVFNIEESIKLFVRLENGTADDRLIESESDY